MKERILTVYEATGTKRNIPRINLQGVWLSKLGFKVGDVITVSFNSDQLIIKLKSPNNH